MPFVSTPPLMLTHLQPDNDPVRAAAEAMDSAVEARLLAAWNGLEIPVKSGWTSSMLMGLGRAVRDAAQPVARDLLLARSMGYQAMMRQVGSEPLRKDISLSFHFGRLAPEVQGEADRYAARFVREIGEDTRTTLAAMVQDGVRQGLGPEELARLMRESVGLTVAQAKAVQNYRRLLETGSPEALDRALRDRRFDIAADRLADLTPGQIDARVGAYRRRYVTYRAHTISRYETLFASNSGSLAAIQSSIKTGLLPTTTMKRWMIARDENTCERCRSIPEIQPVGVGIDEAFTWRHGKRGGLIYAPPLHPDCRCSISYRVQ